MGWIFSPWWLATEVQWSSAWCLRGMDISFVCCLWSDSMPV